jgi:hypothetical protein
MTLVLLLAAAASAAILGWSALKIVSPATVQAFHACASWKPAARIRDEGWTAIAVWLVVFGLVLMAGLS